jgi:hypothetical protein
MAPASRAASTASAISWHEAIPVDRSSGRRVRATRRTRARSTISNEAILYAGTSIPSRKSTAEASKGVENRSSPRASASALSRGCHSHGVAASRYRWCSRLPSHSVPAATRNQGASLSRVMVSAV